MRPSPHPQRVNSHSDSAAAPPGINGGSETFQTFREPREGAAFPQIEFTHILHSTRNIHSAYTLIFHARILVTNVHFGPGGLARAFLFFVL